MLENSEQLNQARISKFKELLLKMKAPADSGVLRFLTIRRGIDVIMTALFLIKLHHNGEMARDTILILCISYLIIVANIVI